MNSFDEEETEAKEKAERLGLSFYVSNGYYNVFDGGKRFYQCAGGFTVDGETWEGSSNHSYRRATESEIEMWNMLP